MKARLYIFLSVLLAATAVARERDNGFKRLSEKQIKALEQKANTGRALFKASKYAEAEAVFDELTTEMTVSTPLYLCELGSCRLAQGDWDGAHKAFVRAATLVEGFFDARSEKSAGSVFGTEIGKVFKGYPYEKSMLGLFLGLSFLRQNDVDNALASLKNAILYDSDVEKDEYKCDFALLQALEALCYHHRTEPDMLAQSQSTAEKSFVSTHPRVRKARASLIKFDDSMEKGGRRTRRAMEKAAAKRQGLTPEQARSRLLAQVEKVSQSVDTDYVEPLLEPEFNTLLVVWSGECPSKQRAGKHGERAMLVVNPSSPNRYEINVDGETYYDAIQGVCDVSFQATTRGGRLMDNVLKSQAEFKEMTDGLGDSLINHSDDVSDPTAQLALLAIGLISKGVSAATNPEADIRQWATLPDTLQVLPLKLEPGAHQCLVEEYDGLVKTGERFARFEVSSDRLLNVVVVMPEPQPEPEAGLADSGGDV